MTKLADITQTILSNESAPIDAFNVTPNDSVDLPRPIRGFMVAVDGDVEVTFWDGANRTGGTVVLPACKAGVQYLGLIRRILASNTTATGIVGLV